MGCHSSSHTPSFAEIVEKAVTSVNAISDLAAIIADLVGEEVKEENIENSSVLEKIEEAMKKMKPYVIKKFEVQYDNKVPEGPDTGIILDFSSTGDLTQVIKTLALNLKNWGFPVTDEIVSQMAATIQQQVIAELGAVDFSYGVNSLDANTDLGWGVSYGTFRQDEKNFALVYGFCAQEISNWQK